MNLRGAFNINNLDKDAHVNHITNTAIMYFTACVFTFIFAVVFILYMDHKHHMYSWRKKNDDVGMYYVKNKDRTRSRSRGSFQTRFRDALHGMIDMCKLGDDVAINDNIVWEKEKNSSSAKHARFSATPLYDTDFVVVRMC